jgi:hypothetical protein
MAAHLSARAKNSFGSEATLAIAERQRAGFERPKGRRGEGEKGRGGEESREGFGALCRIDTSVPVAEAHAQVWQDVLAALAEQV